MYIIFSSFSNCNSVNVSFYCFKFEVQKKWVLSSYCASLFTWMGPYWFSNIYIICTFEASLLVDFVCLADFCGKRIPKAFRTILRDGPFDIKGGWDFSSRQVIFFSLFAQHIKIRKCKRKQHIE